MKNYKKKNLPVDQLRRLLEPGPIILVSSAWKGERNIMTMGWHMIMGFEPSLVGCYIWDENHSYNLIRKSKECVINVPATHLAKTVVGIGNCSGSEVDKFQSFGLTAEPAKVVSAPLIKECFANFECKLIDSSQIKKYSLFIFEVVNARMAQSPKFPETIHYRGAGEFMISGPTTSRYKKLFKPEMLD
jgi:flavin reductase (DIM6/NTAB) family NADH-FMN oxidoreductase RutF